MGPSTPPRKHYTCRLASYTLERPDYNILGPNKTGGYIDKTTIKFDAYTGMDNELQLSQHLMS